MTEFFRFPHTHHLIWLGDDEPRGDKVLLAHEVDEMLAQDIIIEEKLDGANLGLSLDADGELQAQNRGSYLERPCSGQFSRLNSWMGQYEEGLKRHLTPDRILFGEWCAAQHSLDYHALPDWFLLFDVYDRSEEKFWSVARRDRLAAELGLATVPELGRGHFDRKSLTRFLEQASSRYRAGQVEGIVIRRDSEQWNESRAKFVNKGFVQAIEEHWRSRTIQWNQVERS
jgi:ATP-dependent RNA circularization protein (DNA/RNA ligase family)